MSDQLINLDDLFQEAATTQPKKNKKETKVWPSGGLVQITFHPGSILGEAYAALQASATSPKATPQSANPTITAIIIHHSPGTKSIQIRLYDLDTQYNTQSQSMAVLSLDEIERIDFISMVHQSTLENIPQKLAQNRIHNASERRSAMRALINPNVSERGQQLILYLAKKTISCSWQASLNSIIVQSRYIITNPYGAADLYLWDDKTGAPKERCNEEFIISQIHNFERDYDAVLVKRKAEEDKRKVEEDKRKAAEEQQREEELRLKQEQAAREAKEWKQAGSRHQRQQQQQQQPQQQQPQQQPQPQPQPQQQNNNNPTDSFLPVSGGKGYHNKPHQNQQYQQPNNQQPRDNRQHSGHQGGKNQQQQQQHHHHQQQQQQQVQQQQQQQQPEPPKPSTAEINFQNKKGWNIPTNTPPPPPPPAPKKQQQQHQHQQAQEQPQQPQQQQQQQQPQPPQPQQQPTVTQTQPQPQPQTSLTPLNPSNKDGPRQQPWNQGQGGVKTQVGSRGSDTKSQQPPQTAWAAAK